jgi:nicotinate-nucleotide pyrophosphorylase (carboxylating)
LDEAFGTDEVRRALAEDRARDDVTTRLLGPAALRPARGAFRVEEPCAVAGLPIAQLVFTELDPAARFEPCVADGAAAEPEDVIAVVHGTAGTLLAGERTALNFLQRLSGIATATRRAVDAVANTGVTILDTRKTTPGLRPLEKYAVRVGGGANHRASLGDAVLWKDNHWKLLEASGGTLKAALAAAGRDLPVVVEVETEEQLEAALTAGVTHILVDNQSPDRLAEWVQRVGSRVAVEASGGITPETARAYANAGARYISMGALTHSAPAVGISFELELASS